MELQLNDLVWDKKIYPRPNKSDQTIKSYTEAMQVGAEFPSIEVQKVNNYDEIDKDKEFWIIIDGVHRYYSYRGIDGIDKVEAIEWQSGTILDYEKTWRDILLRAAEKNVTHGDRLSDKNKSEVAKDIANADPDIEYTEEAIAVKLKVAQQRVNEWIKEIRAKQRAGRNSVIVRLSRLGWTQEEIGEAVDLDQSVISKIMQNTEFGILHNFLTQGRSMDWITEHLNIDLALAWSLRLEDKTDQERFGGSPDSDKEAKELRWGLRTWDNWNFTKCDERFGDDWPGRIPAQLVAHTLFYFTKQGDLVFDPMAGGGVVPDTCLAFGRKCRAYDSVTRNSRPEIEQHYWELGTMKWPDLKKKPDLIFFDPPYFSKKEVEYEDKADGETTPISSLPRDSYLEFFEQFFLLAKENTKKGARVAFLNADWRDFQSVAAIDEEESHAITMIDYADLLKKTGWIITHIIDCPMSSQRFSGGVVSQMQKGRILGVVRRTLLIAKVGR